jgi:DNA repair exonuclease SbcCD ATPase subunit
MADELDRERMRELCRLDFKEMGGPFDTQDDAWQSGYEAAWGELEAIIARLTQERDELAHSVKQMQDSRRLVVSEGGPYARSTEGGLVEVEPATRMAPDVAYKYAIDIADAAWAAQGQPEAAREGGLIRALQWSMKQRYEKWKSVEAERDEARATIARLENRLNEAHSFINSDPERVELANQELAEARATITQLCAQAIDADHLARQREWSERTFGPGPRTGGVIEHIRKELREIEAEPADLGEWVDVVILALDGAWRAGHEPEAILAAIKAKQEKNEAREWPDWRTASPDHAIEHVDAALGGQDVDTDTRTESGDSGGS